MWLFQVALDTAPQAAPVAQLGLDAIAPYIRDGGVVAALVGLVYVWRTILRPYLEERDKAQLEAFKGLREDLRSARDDAEKRAAADREAHSRATLQGMTAVSDTLSRTLTEGLRQASERVAVEARRIDDHLSALSNGAGCAAGMAPPSRPPSQPPIGRLRRVSDSPFLAVEADRG